MIDNDILAIVNANAATHHFRFVATAAAEVADDYVVGGDAKRSAAEADSVPRRGLAGDRDARMLDFQIGIEVDRAGDAKDDCSRAVRINGRRRLPGP